MLIREDFPTLERPINAYSGKCSLGQFATLELLMTKSADLIFIGSFLKVTGLDRRLEISFFQPGVKDSVEFLWMFHHWGMPALLDPE